MLKYLNTWDQKFRSPYSMYLTNQALTTIKAFLEEQNSKYQFVEPHNHCVSAAKREIQTFKVHFIAVLCTTDSNCPTQL